MEMVVQFLCVRYPRLFKYSARTGRFWNGVRRMSFDTRRLDPLRFLLENVPEDFAVILEDKKTGNYHLRAGVILSAIGWNMGTKMGLSLHEIHTGVPDYHKIGGSVDRYVQSCDFLTAC